MELVKTCAVQKRCNGCQLQNMDYNTQLHWKQAKLERLFAGICTPGPIVGMHSPYAYRNKSQVSFRTGAKGVSYGLYQSKTKSVTPTPYCMLDHPQTNAIAATLCKLIRSFKLSVYDYHRQTGFVRHALIRRGHYSGQILVTLVCTSLLFPKKKQFVNALLSQHPEITTVVINASQSEKMTLGKKQEILYGPGFITDQLLGKQFAVSPASFYQINTVQTEALYRYALEAADLKSTDRIIDAYCGTGTIGLLAAGQAAHVIGIEQNPDAVWDAVKNARLNQIEHAHFVCADAADYMAEAAKKKETTDVVFIDPPRAGCTQKCLQAILKLNPSKIIYISCDPFTQVRDLNILLKGHYDVTSVQGFDLFPHTKHIESVVVLSK